MKRIVFIISAVFIAFTLMQCSDALNEDIASIAPEDNPDTLNEDIASIAPEDNPDTLNEDIDNTAPEDNPDTLSEGIDNTAPEDNPDTLNEDIASIAPEDNQENNVENKTNNENPPVHSIVLDITDNNGNPANLNGSINIEMDENSNMVSSANTNGTPVNINTNLENNTLTIEIIDPNNDGNNDDNLNISITNTNGTIIEPGSTLNISDATGDMIVSVESEETNNYSEILTLTTTTSTETNITNNTITEIENLEENTGSDTTTSTVVTTTTDPDGTVTVSNRGGMTTISYTDGTNIRLFSNGTASATDQNSTTHRCSDRTYIPIISPIALQKIELNKNYCLIQDIDLSSIANFEPIGYPDPAGNSHKNFEESAFRGVLDGNGKTIRGLRIEKPESDHIGLFSYVGKDGEIKNLIIEEPYIHGEGDVGALVGYNAGIINNVKINGRNDAVIVEGEMYSGGLVGGNSGNIENSNSTGKVTGEYLSGGLVGHNFEGNINNCYATGDVEGTVDTGGLVGSNEAGGSIENCYATGEVINRGIKTGGLVGHNFEGNINNCYATGEVINRGIRVYRIVGADNGSIENSYFYDITASGGYRVGVQGITDSDITGGGEEPFKTTGGWDFTDIWKAKGNGQWPELRWQP